MNFFQLSLFALSIVGASQATKCIPKSGTKEQICTSLSRAGLVNVAALDCSKTTISPIVDILRRDVDDGVEERTYKECCKTEEEVCQSASAAGLINLDLLNCSETNINPEISILSDILKRKLPASSVQKCTTRSAAGLINVSALNCADTEINPVIDILKRNGLSKSEKCQAISQAGLIDLGLLDCSSTTVDPVVDILSHNKRHQKNRLV